MSDTKNILEIKVSRQDNLYGNISQVNLSSVLGEIKGIKHIRQTAYLRKLYEQDQEKYRILKKDLPVVTFCATFDPQRHSNNLQTYNYLLIVDIDHLDEETMQIVKKKLALERLVFSFWESPSGHGIKALVQLKYEFDIEEYDTFRSHRIAFNQIEEYFKIYHEITIDISNKDVARACFISHDAGLSIKKESLPFIVKNVEYVLPPVSKKAGINQTKKKYNNLKDDLHNPASKNNPTNRRLMNLIIRYLTKRSLSITYDYNDWLKVAFAIAESFTFDVGVKYFIALSKLDKDKYDEDNCIEFLERAYTESRGEIGFPTIKFKATEKGFIVNSKRNKKKE